MSDGQRTTAGLGTGEAVGTGRLAAWLVLVGVMAAFAYIGRAAGGDPPDDVLYQYDTAIGSAILYGLIFSIVLLMCRGASAQDLLALRRPNSWKRAGLISLAIFGIMLVLGAVLEPFLDAGEEQGLTPDDWDSGRAGAFAANAVVVAGIAPVVEELTYRGLGFSVLARFGSTAAIVVTAVIFGLGHGLVVALPILVAFGLGLGYLRSRTGSIYPSIGLHALFNALSLALALTV
jgi:membrane protease YdiL (CAAX protease family)